MRQILQAWKARWTSRGWGNWQAKERKAGHLSASDTKQGQMRSQKTHIRQGKKKKRAEECAECGKVSRHSCGIRKGVKTLVSSVEKLQWPIGRKRSTREFCFECIRKQRPVRQNSRGTRICPPQDSNLWDGRGGLQKETCKWGIKFHVTFQGNYHGCLPGGRVIFQVGLVWVLQLCFAYLHGKKDPETIAFQASRPWLADVARSKACVVLGLGLF